MTSHISQSASRISVTRPAKPNNISKVRRIAKVNRTRTHRPHPIDGCVACELRLRSPHRRYAPGQRACVLQMNTEQIDSSSSSVSSAEPHVTFSPAHRFGNIVGCSAGTATKTPAYNSSCHRFRVHPSLLLLLLLVLAACVVVVLSIRGAVVHTRGEDGWITNVSPVKRLVLFCIRCPCVCVRASAKDPAETVYVNTRCQFEDVPMGHCARGARRRLGGCCYQYMRTGRFEWQTGAWGSFWINIIPKVRGANESRNPKGPAVG